MRILRISLHNIASLAGSHTIDFTREPLRSAGLFSISGPTGSGKSTILDALCIALYERTPRLEAARSGAKLADGKSEITQNDPRNLLTRGASEGSAEVAFVGVDGLTYTARWSVRRARNRADGALQGTEVVLFRSDVPPGQEGVVEQGGKKSEVQPVIRDKIGLSFEQFTRAVLLAQNEFATFLRANDTERAEILQALTGTERFEQISIAVFERCSAMRKALEETRARLAGSAPLSTEERAQAEAASAAIEAEWKLASDQASVRKLQAEWFARLRELSTQSTSAEAHLQAAIAARESAQPRRLDLAHTELASNEARSLRDAELRAGAEVEIAAKRRTEAATALAAAKTLLGEKKQLTDKAAADLAAAQTALDTARPQLLEARHLDAKLSPLAQQLARATAERETADSNAKAATATHDTLQRERLAAEDELKVVQTNYSRLHAVAPLASDGQAWLDRLDHAAAARHTAVEAGQELERWIKDETAKAGSIPAERVKESTARAALAAANERVERTEAELAKYDAEKIAAERGAAEQARAALRQLENHFREMAALAQQIESVQRHQTSLRTRDEEDTRALAQLNEAQLPAAEAAHRAALHAFTIAEAALTDQALQLREKLSASEPCPVCGSREHPFAAHPPNYEAASLRALRHDATEKEKILTELRVRAAGLENAIKSGRTHADEVSKVLERLTRTMAEAREFRVPHPAALAIFEVPEPERPDALAARLAAEEQRFKTSEEADASRRAVEKQRETFRTERENWTRDVAALEKALGEITSEMARLQAGRTTASISHDKAQAALQTATAALAMVFATSSDARTDWESDAPAFREKLATEIASFLALEKQAATLAATIREKGAALGPLKEALVRAESERIAKVAAEIQVRNEHEAVRAQRAALFAGRPADAVEAELAAAHRRATEARDQQNAALHEAGKQLATTAETFRAARLAEDEKLTQRAAFAEKVDAWLAAFGTRASRPIDRPALDVLLARDEAWLRAERAALDDLERAVRNAEGACAVHRKNLEVHHGLRPTPDDEAAVLADLENLLRVHRDASLRRDDARARLLADDQRRAQYATYEHELRSREVAALPWERLNELIGSSDGAKFRAIAQRRSLDILIGYANVQLDQLSARYRLERLPESLNLIIVDRDMGDERRSIHSLSGGESFLVSLALALALASLTSNRLRIESLFIDEGFGSLDPETLNTAMSALMRLEALGRKVGVISHVTEMADAIPVQIHVLKGRSGASRLEIPTAIEPSLSEEMLVQPELSI